MGPRALVAVGTLVGIPLAVLMGFCWSRMPLPPLTVSMDAMGRGSWSAVLFSVIIVVVIAVFLIVLVVTHELLHVLAFPYCGLTSATVFGVWPSRLLPYAYHSGPVSHSRLIVVALAPLMILSVAPLIASYMGLLRSPLIAIVSILNSVACGGDVAVCLMIAYQLPINAVLQAKAGDTWWRLAEPSHAMEPAAASDSNGESSTPAQRCVTFSGTTHGGLCFLRKTRSLTVRPVYGAALGAGAVLLGHALEWPNFSGKSGFLATHYMDPILHSIGNDTISICVIASIWAAYGALLVSLVTWPLARRRGDS